MAVEKNFGDKNTQNASAATQVSSALSNLEMQQRLDDLKSEVAAISKTLAAIGGQKYEDYSARFEKLAGDALSASSKAMATARSEVVSMEESFEEQVRQYPLRAVGIAAGVGFLFAMLTRRS